MADNYEAVDMEESDGSGSDNEAFPNKQEYKAYKEQFNVAKAKSGNAKVEDEYGGRGSSEYGGGGSLPGLNRGVGQSDVGGGRHEGGRRDEYNREPTDASKQRDSGARRGHHGGERERRRSKSREDHRRREDRRRSRDRDERRRSKSRERRRSRSRERRDSEDRAGGWRSWNEKRGKGRGGRDRDRDREAYEERQRRREEREQEREEQVRKAEEMGVEIPKYFKPGGVQPVSYAEQVLKRKMLWSKPAQAQQPADPSGEGAEPAASSQQPRAQEQPVKTSWNKWETTNFGDGEKNEKFRRLMGIKSAEPPKAVPTAAAPSAVLSPEEQRKMQSDLETNYEVARQQTHRNKGLGLGFSSAEPYSAPPPPQGGLVLGGFVPKNH